MSDNGKNGTKEPHEPELTDVRTIPTGCLVMNVSMACNAIAYNEMELMMARHQMKMQKLVVTPPDIQRAEDTLAQQKADRDTMVIELNARFEQIDQMRMAKEGIEVSTLAEAEDKPSSVIEAP